CRGRAAGRLDRFEPRAVPARHRQGARLAAWREDLASSVLYTRGSRAALSVDHFPAGAARSAARCLRPAPAGAGRAVVRPRRGRGGGVGGGGGEGGGGRGGERPPCLRGGGPRRPRHSPPQQQILRKWLVGTAFLRLCPPYGFNAAV